MLTKKIIGIKNKRKQRQQYNLRRKNLDSGKLRLSVFVSRFNIFAQLIDDEKNITLCSFDTKQQEYKDTGAKSYNSEGAKTAGKIAGKKFNTFIENNCSQYKGIYVDRCGRTYHSHVINGVTVSGRLASFIDEIRAAVTKWSF